MSTAGTWSPWAVGLGVFLVVAVGTQLVLSGGGLLVAIPLGIVTGVLWRRRHSASTSPEAGPRS